MKKQRTLLIKKYTKHEKEALRSWKLMNSGHPSFTLNTVIFEKVRIQYAYVTISLTIHIYLQRLNYYLTIRRNPKHYLQIICSQKILES